MIPSTSPKSGARKRYAFRDYLNRRALTMLALGFSSGLPFLLVGNTFGFWLRDEGTTAQALAQIQTQQNQLETTRAELRRGILELPQETAESASQMRRVIIDQVASLTDQSALSWYERLVQH